MCIDEINPSDAAMSRFIPPKAPSPPARPAIAPPPVIAPSIAGFAPARGPKIPTRELRSPDPMAENACPKDATSGPKSDVIPVTTSPPLRISAAEATIPGSTPASPPRAVSPLTKSPVCSADVTPPINAGLTSNCCAKAFDKPATRPPDASAAATAELICHCQM